MKARSRKEEKSSLRKTCQAWDCHAIIVAKPASKPVVSKCQRHHIPSIWLSDGPFALAMAKRCQAQIIPSTLTWVTIKQLHRQLQGHWQIIYKDPYCWWKKSGVHQLRFVVYPIIFRIVYCIHPKWWMFSMNSMGVLQNSGWKAKMDSLVV